MIRRDWSPGLALSVVVLLTFGNIFDNAWLFDDEFLILRNTFLDGWSTLGRMFTSNSTAGAGFNDLFYRPLQGFAYLLINSAFGRVPWAFHALNLGLHLINAFLVRDLAARLGLGRRASFLGAMIWAVHPLHVEAVTYASATADPLHAAFVLAAVIRAGFASTRRWYFLGLAFFVTGLLAKESAIVTPALLVAVVFARSRNRFSPRAYVRTLPFFAVAMAYVIVRHRLLSFGGELAFFTRPDAYADHFFTRLWTALAALPAYAELLLWPHDLHMDRAFPTFTSPWSWPVAGGLAIVGLAAGLIFAAWRRPTNPRVIAATAALWLFGAHAPHSGLLRAVNSVFLEHWMYLTCVPVCLATGVGLAHAFTRRRHFVPVAGVMIFALAQKTWRQNRIWSTPITFFEHTLRLAPTSARIRHNLAMAYLENNRAEEGLTQLELMIQAKTPYPATYHTAAHAYLVRGDFDRAEPYFLKALQLDPNFYPSAQALAVLYQTRGDSDRAEAFARRGRRRE